MAKRKRSMLEYIQACAALAENKITLAEFTRIMREGTAEEIDEAVERMAVAGGYDNLE